MSSYTYLNAWRDHKEVIEKSWIVHKTDDLYDDHITAPLQADVNQNKSSTKEQLKEVSKPLREKNNKKSSGYKHVPHKEKPPQVVARRNARERRRVQAVNSAFMRLRKAVPIENYRGKRISKVKTLQNAICYIQGLQKLLLEDQKFHFHENECSYHNELKIQNGFYDDLHYED